MAMYWTGEKSLQIDIWNMSVECMRNHSKNSFTDCLTKNEIFYPINTLINCSNTVIHDCDLFHSLSVQKTA